MGKKESSQEARVELAERLEQHANWIENPTLDMASAPKMKADLRRAAEVLREPASTQASSKLEIADKMVDVITTNVGQSAIDVYNTLIKLCEEYRNEPSK